MKKNRRKRILCLLLGLLLCCGCGKEALPVPALIEPLAANDSYRPVEYATIGKSEVVSGVVTAREYCHYYKSAATIASIEVDIGDYVTKGQLLTQIDVEEPRETVRELTREIAQEEKLQLLKEQQYQWQLCALNSQSVLSARIGDTDSRKAFDKQIAILKENHSFDEKMDALKVRLKKEERDESQELIDNSTLVARADGYVCFVKNIASSQRVSGYENVVIVADEKDCCVQLPQTTVDQMNLDTYEKIITRTRQGEYELVEYPYSRAELAMAQSVGSYPTVRFTFVDKTRMPAVGATVPIFLMKHITEHVLVVGKDCIQKDNKGSFVYVKEGESRAVRYVELGAYDDFNYQVISGVKEGEMIYYSSDAVLPEYYEEIPVTEGTFSITGQTSSFQNAEERDVGYSCEVEGRVTKCYVSEGTQVSRGDKICDIQTDEGRARLTELSNQMTALKDAHEKQQKELDLEIAEKQKQMNLYESQLTEINVSENDIQRVFDPVQLQAQLQELQVEKEMEQATFAYTLESIQQEYDKADKNNDGNGVITVYAQADGVLSNVSATQDKLVHESDRLFVLKQAAKSKVELITKDELMLQQSVTFTEEKTGKKYVGSVRGYSRTFVGDKPKIYIETIDNKVYITTCGEGSPSDRYYVQMEDDSFYDSLEKMGASYVMSTMDDMLMIPANTVYVETDRISKKEYSYVWKVVDGNLAKQYVTLSERSPQEMVCVIQGLKAGDVVAGETTKGER